MQTCFSSVVTIEVFKNWDKLKAIQPELTYDSTFFAFYKS